MYRVLPPLQNVPPHTTSPFGAKQHRPPDSTNPHRGVDFNYFGGQEARLNKNHPEIHSPVDGIVTNAGEGTVGRIAIRDKDGFLHEILHTQKQNVSVGDQVSAGQLIGTMGNTGTHDQHVHYQLRDPAGKILDPSFFWNQRGLADPNTAPPAHLNEYEQYLHRFGAGAGAGAAGVPGAATMPAPGLSDASSVQSTPQPAEAFRYLGRRVLGRSKSSVFDTGTPAAPFVASSQSLAPGLDGALDGRFGNWTSLPAASDEAPSDAGNFFVNRFGNWISTPAGIAPASSNGSLTPANGPPLGIVSGQPMPNFAVPPPIRGRPNVPSAPDDDWLARLLNCAPKPIDLNGLTVEARLACLTVMSCVASSRPRHPSNRDHHPCPKCPYPISRLCSRPRRPMRWRESRPIG